MSQSTVSTLAEWIKQQQRTSALPPNAPGPTARRGLCADHATVQFSAQVGTKQERPRRVLWWGARPRHALTAAITLPAADAYGDYPNMGVATVSASGRLTFKAATPQPYWENGTLWPPHFHYVYADGTRWNTKQIHTIAGYPGHHDTHEMAPLKGLADHHTSMSSILTPEVVRALAEGAAVQWGFPLRLVNALPKGEANVNTKALRVAHMHVPYDSSKAELARAAKAIGAQPYVVYCEHAGCSAASKLIARMIAAGATNVSYMPAGRRGWAALR